ncbi:caspase domain-containing protein [Lentzea sp. NPDC058450]|uniref:caspase family protein n=1 Tax=Lentzea sp. NPDC058450 TaxID=3346505 RepID=UPI003668EF82
MERRALVIGSATYGLTGVHNDVTAVSAAFEQRGFTVDRREGEDATRAGILDGYEKLIAESGSGDVAAVFYSGHGSSEPPDEPRRGPQANIQCIVSYDFVHSAPDDFRGITSLELSVLLARLTRRTRNCLALLDCCHSAHMSRDPAHRPRAIPSSPYLRLAAHNERRRKEGMEVGLPDVIGNRYAVRLVACAPEQSAYEYTNAQGTPMGMFTESFCLALNEAGDQRVTWASLLRRVRRRVELLAPTQTPAVEGPSSRLLFDEEEADQTGVLAVVPLVPDRIELPGARLSGVVVGDEFTVEPDDDAGVVIADATVDRLRALRAEALVKFRSPGTTIPVGAVARPSRVAALRWPVRVNGDDEVADRVRAALTADAVLRPAGDEQDSDTPELAVVDVTDELSVRDSAGPLFAPVGGTDDVAVKHLVNGLARLARVATLRGLRPVGAEALDEPFSVEWGLVVDGGKQPLRPSGEVLHPGDQIYFTLRNDSARKLYFAVLDLGVDASVTLVLSADHAGLRLDPGEEYVIGERDDGTLEGVEITMPPIPAGVPRPETVLVIVSGTSEDLSVLGQEGVREPRFAEKARRTLAEGTTLQRVLAQAVVGGSRNIRPARARDISKFAASRLDFLLSPVERPPGEEVRFHVDERPDRSVTLLRPRADEAVEVEIRLRDLVLGDVGRGQRVDVLVVAGGAGGVPVWRANTIRIGGTTSVPDVVLDRGTVVGQLDLAVWLSDDDGALDDLVALLDPHGDEKELRRTAVRLAGQASAQPWTAAPVASAFVSASLVKAAHALLSGLGTRSPLLRTTLLAHQDFGAGRHPHRTDTVSFAYDVVVG